MKLVFDATIVPDNCFIGVFHNIEKVDSIFNWHDDLTKYNFKHQTFYHDGGAGWLFVGYQVQHNDAQTELHNVLKEKFPILYQSDVRINCNTGNKVFFVIYDTSSQPGGFRFCDNLTTEEDLD